MSDERKRRRMRRNAKQRESEARKYKDEEWKVRIGRANLHEFKQAGGRTKGSEAGPWVTCHCPFHGDDKNPSARLCIETTTTDNGVSYPGHFVCHVCHPNGGGLNIIQWLAEMTHREERDVAAELEQRYYSNLYTSVERHRSGAKKLEAVPDAKTLERYKEKLWTEPAGIETVNWYEHRGISKELLTEFEIGFNNYRIILMIRDETGKVRNLQSRKVDKNDEGPRFKSLTGQPKLPYPLHMADLNSSKRIICEGLTDLMTIWGIGERSVLTMGGNKDNTFKALERYLPTGEGSVVYIAQDNDSPGRGAAKNLVRDIMKAGKTETVINLTAVLPEGDDVNDYLRKAQDEDHKRRMWESLLQTAPKRSVNDRTQLGVVEVEGQLTWDHSGEVLAPFLGHVTRCGIEKLGAARGATIYIFQLTHVHGEQITVQHKMGESFERSVQNADGKVYLFKFERRYEDKILTFLIHGADATLVQKDIGWIFGYDATNGHRETGNFYTPDILFTPKGPVPQDKLEVHTPHTLFDRVHIPRLDDGQLQDALSLLWNHVYPCHRPDVMAPLLASAFLAPLRERHFPQLPRFPVLVYGPSGSGKTSRCRLVQALYGDFFSDTDLLSWRSTSKAVEHLTSIAGDMWLLIDEMQIEKMTREARHEAMEFLKSVPQGLGRARMKMSGDGLQSMPYPPTSIVALTMEVLAIEDEGLLSRCLLVKVPQTNLLDPALRFHTESTWRSIKLLSGIMTAWIKAFTLKDGWFTEGLVNRYQRAQSFCKKALEEECPFWTALQNAPRLINRLEVLTAVWHSVIFMSYDAKVLSAERGEALCKEWEEVVRDIIRRCIVTYQASGLERSFMDIVASGLQSGNFHLDLAGRMNAAFGEPIPSTRTSNSCLIGYFKNSGPTQESISFRGRQIEVALASSSARLMGRDSAVKWRIYVEYMKNNGYLREISRAGASRERVMWMTQKGAEMILDGVEGFTVGEDSADQVEELKG